MKLTAERSVLLAAFRAVAGGVAKNHDNKPVLTCVKLSAPGGCLTLTATDNETTIRLRASLAQVIDPPPALVPHDRVVELLKAAPDGWVTIDAADGGGEGEAQTRVVRVARLPGG